MLISSNMIKNLIKFLYLFLKADVLSYSFPCSSISNINMCNFTELLRCVNNTCNCAQQLYWNSTLGSCGN